MPLITEIEEISTLALNPNLKEELVKNITPEDLGKVKKGFELYNRAVAIE